MNQPEEIHYVSQSKFLWGLQCHKLLWHAYNAKAQVSGLSRTVEDKLGDMFKAIRLPVHPDIAIGPHCDDPYSCPLHDHCRI